MTPFKIFLPLLKSTVVLCQAGVALVKHGKYIFLKKLNTKKLKIIGSLSTFILGNYGHCTETFL